MAYQKQFTVKIFDQDGTTFLKSLTSDRPSDLTLPFLKNVPTFRSRINGGFGECVLDLAYPFDDFDEGVTVDFNNIVRIYAVKTDKTVSPPTQSSTLIYTGFISKYEPYIESGGEEGVRVTCLGLISLLSASYYKSGSSFAVTHTTQDPETIARAVIDHFKTIYGGSLLSYSNDSTDPVGTNVSVTFTDQRWSDALKKTGELAGTDWWWKVDETGLYWLKAKPGTATHTFTIGKDIDSLNAIKDGEKVINDLAVRRTGGTETSYSDATSQAEFGTGSPATGKRSSIITDSSLIDANAADQRGNKEINDNKNPKVRSPFVVNTKYDLESIQVGETCKIMNLKNGNTFFGSNMLIVSIVYRGDTVEIELEEAGAGFGNELAAFVLNNAPASSSSGGGGTTATFVDRETPTGTINGTNTAFTLSQTPIAGSDHVYLNGVLQNAGGADYSIAGTAITFVTAPPSGSVLLVSYRISSGTTTFADKQTPSGTINGTNTSFTLANTPTTGSLHLFLNGILQNEGAGNDFTVSGTTITCTSAPPSGSVLLASYRY